MMEKYNNQIVALTAISIGVTLTVSWLEIKPYGIFFAAGLAYYLLRTLYNPDIFKMVLPSDSNNKILSCKEKLINFRKNNPTEFCVISTIIIGTIAFIGHILSGSTFVVAILIITGLISTRYSLRVMKVPPVVNFLWDEKFDQDLTEEFLPEENDANLFVLERASKQASSTSTTILEDDEDKSDEIPSDLLIPDSIPEIDENSDTSEDDLAIKSPPTNENKKHDKLVFKKTYFKYDSSISSSSSDEELSKGLNFDSIDSPKLAAISETLPLQKSQSSPAASATSQAVQLASQLPGFVTGLVSWSMGSGPININTKSKENSESTIASDKIETSDESDFEILDNDELTN